MLIVVSDTSPILNLRRIGQLELLILLYGEVLVPPAVFAELIAKTDLVSMMDGNPISSLILVTPRDQKRVQGLRHSLDAGDAEAIALAIERHADLLLVDERPDDGRPRPRDCGLPVCSVSLPMRNALA